MLKIKEASETFPISKHYETIEQDLKWLTGKILTIIDGAIIDDRQNKAVKDQIKEVVSKLLWDYQSHCSEGKAGHSIKFNK